MSQNTEDRREIGQNWPRLYYGGRMYFWSIMQRLVEAWLILSGSHSLHRAWQAGKDQGNREEYRRLITNKGYLGEVNAPRLNRGAP